MSISISTSADGRKMCPVDHHSVEFAQGYREIQDQIREAGAVVWSDHHGGFWFVTDYESVREALLDHETFTMNPVDGAHEFGPLIPQPEESRAMADTPGLFFFVDGDRHDIPKAVLGPPLSQRRLEKKAEMTRTHVDRELDRVLPRGSSTLFTTWPCRSSPAWSANSWDSTSTIRRRSTPHSRVQSRPPIAPCP